MAYLTTTTAGTVSGMSLVAWIRCPSESFSISENILAGGNTSGYCNFGINIGSSVACSMTFGSPIGYFPDTEYGGNLYQYLRAEAFASSSSFASGGADKWFLYQASLKASGGNLNTGSSTEGGYGKVSYAINANSLATTTSWSTIVGLYWQDYGGGNGQWLSHFFPWASFGTWPIGFTGTLRIPDQYGKKIEFGDIYCWTSFIDFNDSNNRAKFIRVVGGLAYPANPSVPIAAFGTPAIHFRGKASDNTFFFNRGNLGSFSKIGTASDFTPAPSY